MSDEGFGGHGIRNISGVVKLVQNQSNISNAGGPRSNALHPGSLHATQIAGTFTGLTAEPVAATQAEYKNSSTNTVEGAVFGDRRIVVNFRYQPRAYANLDGTMAATYDEARAVVFQPGDMIVLEAPGTNGNVLSAVLGAKAANDTNDETAVFHVQSAPEDSAVNGDREFNVTAIQWGGAGLPKTADA